MSVNKKSKRFTTGHAELGGRTRGVPNKTSRLLKDALLTAAMLHGSDRQGKDGSIGYCFLLASEERKTFARLLGRILPLQVTRNNGVDFPSIDPAMLRTLSVEERTILGKVVELEKANMTIEAKLHQ